MLEIGKIERTPQVLSTPCGALTDTNLREEISVAESKHTIRAGDVFGKWTVMDGPGSKKLVRCRCHCGREKCIARHDLLKSRTTQCLQCSRRSNPSRVTHGDSRNGKCSVEYRCWLHIKGRCTNPSNKAYVRYGGRGIRVCTRWLDSFESFLSDMGRKPADKHSIDRINNDGNYEPGNCRWSTSKEQSRNYSRNVRITANGETRLLTDLAELLGISYLTIHMRLRKLGWSEDRAINTPVKRRKRGN